MAGVRNISQKVVKTRKEHQCWGCCSMLPKGVKVQRDICIDEDRWVVCYWCSNCIEFMATMDPWDLEYIPMGMIAETDGYDEFNERGETCSN